MIEKTESNTTVKAVSVKNERIFSSSLSREDNSPTGFYQNIKGSLRR